LTSAGRRQRQRHGAAGEVADRPGGGKDRGGEEVRARLPAEPAVLVDSEAVQREDGGADHDRAGGRFGLEPDRGRHDGEDRDLDREAGHRPGPSGDDAHGERDDVGGERRDAGGMPPREPWPDCATHRSSSCVRSAAVPPTRPSFSWREAASNRPHAPLTGGFGLLTRS
jgi:hypothetical protein